MKHMKGNHRRTSIKTFIHRGVIGNTYNTPTFCRGAKHIKVLRKKHVCMSVQIMDAFYFIR